MEPSIYTQFPYFTSVMSRFLMHYIGGGTDYPFELLKKSCSECAADQPIRVVIRDYDFDRNYEAHADNAGIFATAVEKSRHCILLSHSSDADRIKLYRAKDATVVEVKDLADFPGLATELTHSLFPDMV